MLQHLVPLNVLSEGVSFLLLLAVSIVLYMLARGFFHSFLCSSPPPPPLQFYMVVYVFHIVLLGLNLNI